MNDWLQYISNAFHYVMQAPATIWTSLVAAAIAVAIEFRRHTWATALLALVSGAFVAYIATEPLVTFFGLPSSAGHAIAGVLGISGRNLIVWLLQVSKDPMKAWRGRGE